MPAEDDPFVSDSLTYGFLPAGGIAPAGSFASFGFDASEGSRISFGFGEARQQGLTDVSLPNRDGSEEFAVRFDQDRAFRPIRSCPPADEDRGVPTGKAAEVDSHTLMDVHRNHSVRVLHVQYNVRRRRWGWILLGDMRRRATVDPRGSDDERQSPTGRAHDHLPHRVDHACR